MKVRVQQNDCIGCGVCIEACPAGAISLVENKATINHAECRGCGVCIDACPAGVIDVMVSSPCASSTDIVPSADQQTTVLSNDSSNAGSNYSLQDTSPTSIVPPVLPAHTGLVHDLSLSFISMVDRVVHPTQSSFAHTLRERQQGHKRGNRRQERQRRRWRHRQA